MDVGANSLFSPAGTNPAGSAGNDAAKLAEDFDDFLTLLTTQLQNQDPLDPMDSGEFTQQLVAFTGVEQQIQANQNLETLADLSRLNNIGNVASYLGNEALIEQPTGDHATDGITWKYGSDQPTDSVVLNVVDENGSTVFQQTGETGLGIKTFNWDGTTTSGSLAAPGNYTLEIAALDNEGNSISTNIAVQETITAVDTTGFEPIFTIGPNNVGQTDILRLIYGR